MVVAGLLDNHHLVDHICVPVPLATTAAVTCWEITDAAGVRLSDHPTVAIDLDTTYSLQMSDWSSFR